MALQPKVKKKRKTPYPKVLGKRAGVDTRLILILVALCVLIGVVVIFSGRAGTSSYKYNTTTKTPSGRMFTDDSPLNQRIPSDVRYKSDSAARLKAAGLPAAISLFEWSVPVFDVDATTPKVNIWCYLTDIQASWDTCNGLNLSPQPVPAGVFAQRGGDGHLLIVDSSKRTITNYWIWKDCFLTFNLNNAKWCPASGNIASIDGNGVGGGENVAKLAGGIIRTYEIERGYIDHAITFSSANTCKGDPVYPALFSDGTTLDQTSCIPIGSRLQLDPTINVDALTNITPMEKMIAKAMQQYGAYADDTGGIFGFGVEFDRTGRKVYQKVGAPETDHFALKGIPWDKVKIIEPQWKRDGTKAYAWGATTTSSTPTTTIISSPSTTGLPTPTATTSPSPSPSTTPTPTLDTTAPTAPTSLKPGLQFDWLTGRYVVALSWKPSSDNIGVKDYVVAKNGQALTNSQGLLFVDKSVEANVQYQYEVKARDARGNVSQSATTSVVGRCFLIWCWLE